MGSARGRCDNKSGLLVVLVSWQVPPLQRHWPHSGPPKTEGHRQEPSCGCGMPCLQIRVVFFEKTGKLWMGERTRRRATRVMTWSIITGRISRGPELWCWDSQFEVPGSISPPHVRRLKSSSIYWIRLTEYTRSISFYLERKHQGSMLNWSKSMLPMIWLHPSNVQQELFSHTCIVFLNSELIYLFILELFKPFKNNVTVLFFYG